MKTSKLFIFFTLFAAFQSPAMQPKLRTDEKAGTKLCNAALEGNIATVKELLNSIHIDARDQDGNTALMWAANADDSAEDFEMIRFLIEAGADVNAQNKCGETALIFAIESVNDRCVQLLLSHGSNVFLEFKKDSWWGARAGLNGKRLTALSFSNSYSHCDLSVSICEKIINHMFRIPSPQQKTRMLCFLWCMKQLGKSYAAIGSNVIKPHFIKSLRALIEQENRTILKLESIAYQEVSKLSDGPAKPLLMEKYFKDVFDENN